MALPAHLTPITVTCTYTRTDGTSATGTVDFLLSAPAGVPADATLVPQAPITAMLNGSGSISIVLPASDSSGWAVTGLTYQVTERISGTIPRVYNIPVPAASPGGTVNLAAVAPAVPGPALVSYVLAATVGAVGGPAGPLDAGGKLPAAQVPASASPVQSVAGKTGTVVLVAGDVSGVETSAGAQAKANAAQDAAAADAAGRYARLSYVDVRAYGAVGDGVADDTTAILAATTAAEARSRAILYLPAGTYKITAPWSVNPRRVAIVGDGPQATMVVPTGLAAGAYALTLGWDNNVETGNRPEPYDAIRGVSFLGPTGAGQANCLRLNNASANGRAHSLTFRDVGFYGFDVQVDLINYVYLALFDRCLFTAPQTYGVRMDNVTGSGENISFRSCVFSGGPGTMAYLNMTGASFFFAHCSFDYCARAVWQRAGQASFTQCHFETNTTYGGAGKEYLLLDRRGSVNRPLMTLTDCEFYDAWDNYDTAIRLRGDNGDQGLRVINPYIRTSATMCQYFVRDDGPFASNILVSGAWYGQDSFVPPKLRVFGGNEWPISSRATYAGRPSRTLRRASPNVVEPFPVWGARGSEALTSGRMYLVLFQPEEEITISKIAFWTGATVAAGLTLAKVALYEWSTAQLSLRGQSASDTTLATVANQRYEAPLAAPYRCQTDGRTYALSLLFVGTTMPTVVTAGNNNFAPLRDATYGHPAGLMVTGQTDVTGPIFPGSWASPDRLPYLVGAM